MADKRRTVLDIHFDLIERPAELSPGATQTLIGMQHIFNGYGLKSGLKGQQWQEGVQVPMSAKDIAEVVNRSERQVQRDLLELEKHGRIKTYQSGKLYDKNTYELLTRRDSRTTPMSDVSTTPMSDVSTDSSTTPMSDNRKYNTSTKKQIHRNKSIFSHTITRTKYAKTIESLQRIESLNINDNDATLCIATQLLISIKRQYPYITKYLEFPKGETFSKWLIRSDYITSQGSIRLCDNGGIESICYLLKACDQIEERIKEEENLTLSSLSQGKLFECKLTDKKHKLQGTITSYVKRLKTPTKPCEDSE